MSETTIKFRIPSLTDGEIEAVSRNQAIRKVIRIVVDKIALVVLTVGSLATIASAVRAFHLGWHLNIILDIAAFMIVVVFVLLRRFLSAVTVASALLITAGLVSVSNFYTVGLASMGISGLIAICVITGAFFGFRIGAAFIVVSAVAMAVAAVLTNTGVISAFSNVEAYLSDPGTWVSQITGYVLYGLASLVVVTFIQKRLWSALAEIHQKSEALREREERYRLLAENMRDVLIFWDMTGRFTYVSPSARELFGYSVKEILRFRVDDLLTPAAKVRWDEQFQHYQKLTESGEVDIPLLEFEFFRENGSRFFGELKSAFIRNDRGDIVGIQGNLRDVSDRKHAEEEKHSLVRQLHHSEKMRAIGQLAGGVAHDFNNQLASIMGLADLLQSRYAGDQKISTYANGIIAGVDRASDLTQKLLAFARKGKYQSTIIDMHAIVNEVISIVGRSLDKTIRIIQNLEADKTTIRGDPGQIQNALLNIAINARDAMPGGGDLTFASRLTTRQALSGESSDGDSGASPYLSVIISDTGVGMSPEVKARIFEPFFTTKDSEKGTGMGLAAVYGTVQNHDGFIDVRSAPGEGATFCISFPVCSEPVTVREPEERPEPVSGHGRIIVVDDEPMVLDMTSKVLERLGYQVSLCADGAEAVRMYRDTWQTTDLVVLDLILPEISGRDVFSSIRKINPAAKIVICSGYSADGEVQKLLEDDITDFVQKPFTMGAFSQAVARLLNDS